MTQGSKTKFIMGLLEKKCDYVGFCENEDDFKNCYNSDHVYCPHYQDLSQVIKDKEGKDGRKI